MGTTKSSRVYRKVVLKRNKTTQSGEAPLYLRLTIDRVSRFVSLGKYVNPTYWDEYRGVVLKGGNNSQKLNHFINQEKNKIDRIILDLENQEKSVTFDAILKEYKSGGKLDFIAFCKNEIPFRKGELSDRTINDHLSILRKVEGYQKAIKLHEINYEWIRKFEYHLRNKLENGDNTVAGNIKFIRTYLNRAFKKGLCKHADIDWQVKFEDGDRVPLTRQELQKLYSLWERNELEESLQNVLRYFLFPCYGGGLRFNDVRKLRWSMIEGEKMKVKTGKTGAYVFVPLPGKALRLLPDRQEGNILVFKTHNNKITNRKLEEIFKLAGIERKATFHYSRHTFATIALTLKIPKGVIMKLMGIQNDKVMDIYAKIVDELVVDEMKKFESV